MRHVLPSPFQITAHIENVCVPYGVTILGCSGSETYQPWESWLPPGMRRPAFYHSVESSFMNLPIPDLLHFQGKWACTPLCKAELPLIQIMSSRAQEGLIFGTGFPGWGDMPILSPFTLFVFFLCFWCSLCRLGSFPVSRLKEAFPFLPTPRLDRSPPVPLGLPH